MEHTVGSTGLSISYIISSDKHYDPRSNYLNWRCQSLEQHEIFQRGKGE